MDRAAMACGLEVRSPLLDERILDFTIRHRIRDTPLGREKTALRTLLHLSGRRNYGRKLHAIVAWEVWREKNTLA